MRNRRSLFMSCGVVLLLAVPSVSAAQGESQTLGFLAGVNSTTVSTDTTNIAQRTGMAGGVFMAGSFSKTVGYEIDGLFSQKGAKAFDGRQSEALRIDYFDMPLLLRAGLMPGASGGVFIVAGPVLSLKLGSSATFNNVNDPTWKDENLTSLDVGAVIGVGASVGLIDFTVRYSLGLRTIDATKIPNDVTNRAFTVMVGAHLK